MYISRGELWGGPIRQSLKIAAPRKYRFPESSNTQRRGAVGWQSWPGAAPRPQSWFPRLRVVATVNVDDVRHMGGTGRSCRRREVGKETELLPLRDPDPDPPFVQSFSFLLSCLAACFDDDDVKCGWGRRYSAALACQPAKPPSSCLMCLCLPRLAAARHVVTPSFARASLSFLAVPEIRSEYLCLYSPI